MRKTLALLLLTTLVLSAAACKGKTRFYPDLLPGWSNADYSHVFGRLQRVPPKTADGEVIWIVRFDNPNTPYQGQFALGPAPMLTGYSGGELVEIRGNVNTEFASPDYPGTWYNVQSIRLWNNMANR